MNAALLALAPLNSFGPPARETPPARLNPPSPLHEALDFGPHAVGYQLVEKRDASRSGRRMDDPGRLVRIQLWYPASGGGSQLSLADYELDVEHGFAAAARAKQSARLVEDRPAEKQLLSSPVAARRNSSRKPGAWPLVLASGVDELLCEYVASLGYVVAQPSSPRWGFGVSDGVVDLALAVSVAGAGPKTIVMGFSGSSMTALQYAMRDLDTVAAVSFDGVEIWKSWQGRATDVPWFEPELLALPLLRFDDAGHDPEDVDRAAFFGRAPFVDLFELRFQGLRHVDFALGVRPELAPGLTQTAPARVREAQSAIRGTLRDFLAAIVTGDAGARARLAARADLERRPALSPPPPTTEEAMDLVRDQGAPALLARLEPHLARPGFRLPIRYWSEVLTPALSRPDLEGAADLAAALERQYPTSVSAAYLDGVVKARRKDAAGAAAAFRRAIARGALPSDEESPITRKSLLQRAGRALVRALGRPTGPPGAPAKPIDVPEGRPVLLDGRCEPAEWLGSAAIDLGQGYRLRIQQQAGLAAVCLSVPAGSHGSADYFLSTPVLASPLNLHASAKLGERTARSDGTWPDFTWWNHRGWSASVVGWDRVEGGKPVFLPLADRELVLSTARFGCGAWSFRAEVHDGAASTRLPSEGWLELAVPCAP